MLAAVPAGMADSTSTVSVRLRYRFGWHAASQCSPPVAVEVVSVSRTCSLRC